MRDQIVILANGELGAKVLIGICFLAWGAAIIYIIYESWIKKK